MQLTYIALVFLILILRLFSEQNIAKQSVKSYNSPGVGASRTISSAKASKKIYRDAIV
jgi:hypothetical protein